MQTVSAKLIYDKNQILFAQTKSINEFTADFFTAPIFIIQRITTYRNYIIRHFYIIIKSIGFGIPFYILFIQNK